MTISQKFALRKAAAGVSMLAFFLQIATAATIQIRVLNAKNGTRVADQKVSVLIKGMKAATEYTTDAQGNINADLDPEAEVFVATEWWTTCRKTGSGVDPYISISRVLQEGVTVENTCGRAKTETIKGKLIIFAKKSSLIQLFNK